MERRNKSSIKRNVVENLIKAGVFDFEEPNRQILMYKFDQYNRTKTQIKEGFKHLLREFDKLAWEKEALGIYLSSHPLDKYAFKQLHEYSDNTNCLIAGIIEEVNILYDKKGNEMAFIYISNQSGRIKCLAFSKTWKDKKLDLFSKSKYGNIVMIRGKRSSNDCIINSMEVIETIQ